MGKVGGIASSILLSSCFPALAGDPAPPSGPVAAAAAAVFGAREGVEQISLSPDGSKVAYIAPVSGQGAKLVVLAVTDDAKPLGIALADGKPNRLGGCGWVSDARLVCSSYGVTNYEGRMVNFSRLFAIDADGNAIKQLSTGGKQLGGGSVIDWLPDEHGAVLMTRARGVDRIDTRSLESTTVEASKPSANEYISDGRGTVRIMGRGGGTDIPDGKEHYSYRRPASREWEKLSEYDGLTGEGFNPLAVDRELNLVYGLKKKDGRDALYTVALDGSLKETLIFDRPDVDVDGVARIGRRKRVIGANYQTDTAQTVYFDPDIKKLADALRRATPKTPNIRVIDSSLDERKLLIFSGSDDNPGAYYILDRDKHDLHVFLAARPLLAGRPLASMKPVQYPAADGTMIPAYLTLPPGVTTAKDLPAIVMPHGGPAYRDEWGFDWLPQYYAARGYAVIQPEFRGSTGYGDAWFQKNGFKSWRTAIGDVVDAGRWLVAQKIVDPARLYIVGWSYGGYAALQSAVLAPDLFKAVVAIAPVTDLVALKGESRGWTDAGFMRQYIGSGPEVHEGSPAQNAGRIKVPVLLVHGTVDANVPYNQSTLMQSKLQSAGAKVQLITFPGLDHQLEDNEARKRLLEESDAFLSAAAGG